MNKLILMACVLTGCAVPANRGDKPHRESQDERKIIDLAARADKAAGRTGVVTASATMTYWLGLKAALKPRPINTETAARDITSLPILSVDPDLVREGQLVAQKMQAASASIKSISAFEIVFHYPRSRFTEAEALSRTAIEQCRVVERMRPDLTARFGVEFPPLDVPNP